MSESRYYWLKLKRDFFKRHDIRIIESMPNGKDYILFYLKLLCESVDHDGALRFSELIPYNEDMLAVITYTNVDIVRSAIKAFESLGMTEILDDGTIYMNEVNAMIGSASNTDGANRVRRFRERQKQALIDGNVTKCNAPVTEDVTDHNESKSKSKNKNNINNMIIQDDQNGAKEVQKPKSAPVQKTDDDFEELWKLYPRKIGKDKALKAYLRAKKEGVDKDTIRKGIEAYKAYIKGTEQQYIKHGSTWFNQKGWDDDYTLPNKAGKFYSFEEHEHSSESDLELEKALLRRNRRK